MNYTQQDLLVLGKRYQNQKRSYLLIDPLQAKHIAVSPKAALRMMYTLGQKLYQQHPDTKCIIGFAETATAIAGAAASAFPPDVVYVQTTREQLPETHTILQFAEEHSHAVEQQLDVSMMQLPEGAPILLIDDEISTGKTVANMVSVLRSEISALQKSPFVIGSILNRMSEERKAGFAEESLEFSALLTLQQTDFEEIIRTWEVFPPEIPEQKAVSYTEMISTVRLKNPRCGLTVHEMYANLEAFATESYGVLSNKLHGKVLVLGTEECMLPALLLAEKIEQQATVFCHATTRSPIGISTAEGYPIRNGYRLHSFYEENRTTYLYNIADYDTVIVVTDSQNDRQTETAMQDITSIFPCKQFYLVRG